MNSVAVSNIVDVRVPNVSIVLTVSVRSAVTNRNSFWVLYGQHNKPVFIEDAQRFAKKHQVFSQISDIDYKNAQKVMKFGLNLNTNA